jgi:hypothetical protein
MELVSYPQQHDQAVVSVISKLSTHANLQQYTHLITHSLVTYSKTHLEMVVTKLPCTFPLSPLKTVKLSYKCHACKQGGMDI